MVLKQVAIALDPNSTALQKASQLGIYDRLIPTAVEQSQLPDASIGTIISNSVLEHIPNIEDALDAAARLLRPGGKLIFTVPTEAFSEWLAVPSRRYATWRNQHLCHLNLWSAEQWTQQLERVGLRVETIRPYLTREWVSLWDGLELLQQIWVGKRRLVGLIWKRIPPSVMESMAEQASRLDLSAPAPGGGRLIVARKEN
jgi:SAM-dependent methyltransferase